MPDSTNVVVVKRVRIAPPYFHPLHTIALGDIVARLTVDTLGRPEEGSVVILESTHPSLSASICQDLLEQNFEAAMVDGRPRRTRGDFEAHFRAAQAPKREGQ